MPHLPDHATHDPELIAAFAAGDATGSALDEATALVAECADCAELHRDLRAITTALPELPGSGPPARLPAHARGRPTPSARRAGGAWWPRSPRPASGSPRRSAPGSPRPVSPGCCWPARAACSAPAAPRRAPPPPRLPRRPRRRPEPQAPRPARHRRRTSATRRRHGAGTRRRRPTSPRPRRPRRRPRPLAPGARGRGGRGRGIGRSRSPVRDRRVKPAAVPGPEQRHRGGRAVDRAGDRRARRRRPAPRAACSALNAGPRPARGLGRLARRPAWRFPSSRSHRWSPGWPSIGLRRWPRAGSPDRRRLRAAAGA